MRITFAGFLRSLEKYVQKVWSFPKSMYKKSLVWKVFKKFLVC